MSLRRLAVCMGGAAFMAVAAFLAAPAQAAVRVDQDEVIFTLRIPSATEVYLVGDFNQWNPTVERMERVDDHFEVGLFLVAGEYRYQFVVDGKWMPDPDNPMAKGEKGSPIRLVERGNALVMSTEVASKTAPAVHAQPGVRYIGAMRTHDDTDVAERVDLTVKGDFEHVRARASVATDDTSWVWSPPSVDTWFDRGRVDVDMGFLSASGFENDSIWVSSDPTQLIGNAGVYDYDAGFRRHGAAATVSNERIAVHGLYADATSRAPASTAALPQGPVDAFLSGASSDTTVYAARPSFDGSDVLAVEAALLGKNGAGIVFRRESGANPGAAAELSGPTGEARATIYATRENRAVSSAWVRRDNLLGAQVSGAYGWGSVRAHAFGVRSDSIVAGDVIDAAGATAGVDRTFGVMQARRGLFEVGTRARSHVQASARWDFTRFDFDGLRGASRADVHRVTVSVSDSLGGGWLGLHVRYTDADYDGAPDALAIDWPELNPWLSIWDDYDAARIVGLAFDRYNVASISAGRAWDRLAARVDLTAGLRGVAEEIVHGSARAHVDAHVHGDFHASADARAAWYDGGAWTSDGSLWSGYLEGCYRRGAVELSAGIGFDPLVFNPVTAEYADIGYTEFLRGVLSNGVARRRADVIVRSLIERERALEDASVFKVELVVDLR